MTDQFPEVLPVPRWLTQQLDAAMNPCPFCGNEDPQMYSLGSGSFDLELRYVVQCETCQARGPVALFSQQAARGWNRARTTVEGQTDEQ